MKAPARTAPRRDLRNDFRALFARDCDWLARLLLTAASAADGTACYFGDVVTPDARGRCRPVVDREKIEAVDEVRALCRLAASHLCRAAGVPVPNPSFVGEYGDTLRGLAEVNDVICADQDALETLWRAALGKERA